MTTAEHLAKQSKFYREKVKGKVLVIDSRRLVVINAAIHSNTLYIFYKEANKKNARLEHAQLSGVQDQVARGRWKLDAKTEKDIKLIDEID